jgi:2-oxoglutarate-Fe(II)-dependent oxygenase superfamily protein
MSVVDLERLARVVERGREAFATAAPFPHVVVDDLIDPAVARAVAAEFADPAGTWTYWHHVNERKRGLADRARMGPGARAAIDALEAPEFVALVSRLSGVDGLRGDPHLDGGGLHETLPGGFLNVHTDYLSHPTERAWRREVNLLLFLNERWEPAHRGWLELWDARVSRGERRIEPRFNRAVFFRTSRTSFHGVPEGVACPPGDSRKSIALYYFRDTGAALPLAPTRYVPRPADAPLRRLLIRADRAALWAYALLKRYTPIGDALVSRLLRRL